MALQHVAQLHSHQDRYAQPAATVSAAAAAGQGDEGYGNNMLRVMLPEREQRLAELHAFSAAVQSIAISLSKKPFMKNMLSTCMLECSSL